MSNSVPYDQQGVEWVDTHAHLLDDALRPNIDEVLHRCRQSHVTRLVCVAVDAATSREGCTLHQDPPLRTTPPQIYSSVGIHPNYAHLEEAGDWSDIAVLFDHPRVVAIGETGLDRYWDDCPFDIQVRNFQRHLEASRATGLPVIVHSRDCDQDMLEVLRLEFQRGPIRGIMHSFTGSHEMAHECVAMGMHISFSGILTYKKNDTLRAVATSIPCDRLLVETDAPYLSPEPHRSKRPNEPSMVVHTASVLANCIGVSLSELSQRTTSNALRLFSKMR